MSTIRVAPGTTQIHQRVGQSKYIFYSREESRSTSVTSTSILPASILDYLDHQTSTLVMTTSSYAVHHMADDLRTEPQSSPQPRCFLRDYTVTTHSLSPSLSLRGYARPCTRVLLHIASQAMPGLCLLATISNDAPSAIRAYRMAYTACRIYPPTAMQIR